MRCGILVQARMSSRRLPGKMLMNIGEIPLVLWVLRRCALSHVSQEVVLLTSDHPSDDALAHVTTQAGFACFRGPLNNVRQRYMLAARHFKLDMFSRVCGDSPFVDMEMLDAMLQAAQAGKADYLRLVDTVPGFVSEVCSLAALEASHALAPYEPQAMEHVTTTLCQNPQLFASILVKGCPRPANCPTLTIDTPQDLVTLHSIVAAGGQIHSSSAQVLHIVSHTFHTANEIVSARM